MNTRKTKIIATIGPASIDTHIFQTMVDEGLDFVRVNMAYATPDQIQAIKNNIQTTGKDIPIIYDVRSVEKAEQLKEIDSISWIALSFTETADQLIRLNKMFPTAKVISKIETQKGIDNFESILINAYGSIIARGDLGEAITLEKVPCIQKSFSKRIKLHNKFLIIATEMLLSMVENKTPTRAEVSDVATAVFENADAVMLSEETAVGKNPIDAVSYMRKIIESTETCYDNQ